MKRPPTTRLNFYVNEAWKIKNEMLSTEFSGSHTPFLVFNVGGKLVNNFVSSDLRHQENLTIKSGQTVT